jgi:hypothetical protein
MTPQNADSLIRLSPTKTENFRPIAEVSLADVKTGTSNTTQSNIDKQTWDAMDALADEVALIFANRQPFEVLMTKEGKTVSMPAGTTGADLRAAHPYADRRDPEGSTHHDAGTIECRLRRADGEYRWPSCKGVPRFAPSGVFADCPSK